MSGVDAMELAGRSALVTGGTAGIGLACARLLAGAGASVIVTGRDRHRGERALERIGGGARFIRADLSDADSVRLLVDQAGDVDILVNNAASFPGALTVEQDLPGFEKTFDTNVRGTYFLTAGLVRGMLDRGRGSIVNITSMVAVKGVAGASTYGASKAAVESLTRAWAAEFGSRGVRVNSVAPGPTRTEGVQAEWGRHQRRTRARAAARAHRRTRGDRRSGALPGLTAIEFHHRLDTARRRRRQCRLTGEDHDENL